MEFEEFEKKFEVENNYVINDVGHSDFGIKKKKGEDKFVVVTFNRDIQHNFHMTAIACYPSLREAYLHLSIICELNGVEME